MALSLNTGHALYGDLIRLYCVDDDNVIKDLKGDTCTPHANVTQGTGTYGRHFRTVLNGSNGEGVALTTGFVRKPASNPVGTTFVVINAGNSRANRGYVFNDSSSSAWGPAVYTGDVVGLVVGTGTPGALGTTDIIGTGAHSFGAAVNGTSGGKVFRNGVTENSTAANQGNAHETESVTYIGGPNSGGYGAFAADFVWVAHFRKYLSDAELLDLHNSLGASNTFGLVNAGDTTAPTLTSPTGTQTGSTTASGTVSTDEGNGTLYYLASVNATETAATVKAAASQAVSATGSQSVSFTGLAASTTYYAHYCHRDAAGNDSTVSNSASFTTAAAASAYAPRLFTPRSGMGSNFFGAR